MSDFTTTELLASVKQRGALPASQTTFTDAKILRMANEEMRSMLVPFIMGVREEYFVASKDYVITANQEKYRMPDRAIGSKLRNVVIVDSNGYIRPIPRIAPERRSTTVAGQPGAFYLEANNVGLYPIPSTTQNTLRVYYYQRPGELVTTSSVAVVGTMGTGGGVLTGTPPATFTNTVVGVGPYYDLVNNSPGFETIATDLSMSFTGTTFFLPGTMYDTTLTTGMYVCLAGQSPIPQIPYELHTILFQRTAIKVLEAIGDDAGVARARAQLKEMEQYQTALITNRVDGKPKVITSVGDSAWLTRLY